MRFRYAALAAALLFCLPLHAQQIVSSSGKTIISAHKHGRYAASLTGGSEVGSFPNAAPLSGSERMLSDQNSVTVDITPAQIGQYLGIQTGLIFPLSITLGGTGANTATQAAINLLPTLVANDCLSNSSGALLWAGCGGSPPGSDYQLPYNNDGVWGALAFGTSGYPLLSGGDTAAPAFGQLDLSIGVTGTLPCANGGTGVASTPTNGELLIGNGSCWTAATLTAGTNVTITNGDGTITIAAAGGSGGTPGGSNYELQYNNSSSFGGIALGTSGYALISNGGIGAPAFGQLNLSLAVTGILPVVNGGTGLASLTQYDMIVGNGTGTPTLIAPSTAGEAWGSNGSGANPGYLTSLPGVNNVNSTPIPSSVTLLYNGGPAGTPSSINLSNGSSLPATALPSSGVSAGSYTNANITVDSYGRVTVAADGSSSGGVSSLTGGSGINVSSPTGAVTISEIYTVRTATGSTDTISSTDCSNGIYYDYSGSVSVTLPQAAGSFAGCSVDIWTASGTSVTVTPTTSTINGGSSLLLSSALWAQVVAQSGNYLAYGTATVTALPGVTSVHGTTVPASAGTLNANGASWSMASGFTGGYGAGHLNADQLLGDQLPSIATGFLQWTGSAWAFGSPAPCGSSGNIQYNNSGACGGLTLPSGWSVSGGTLAPSEPVATPITASTYTVPTSVCGEQVPLEASGGVAVTLAGSATFSTGCQIDFTVPHGYGSSTITGSSTTIGANSAITVAADRQCGVNFDGTNWQVIGCNALVSSSGSGAQLNVAQTWSAAQTFPSSDVLVQGSSTGTTALASANAGATNYVATLPAATGTVPLLNQIQAWSAEQTFATAGIEVSGTSGGGTTFSSAASGSVYSVTFPASGGTVVLLGKESSTLTTAYTNATTSYTSILALPAVNASQTLHGYCDIIWEGSNTAITPTFALGLSVTPTDLWSMASYSGGAFVAPTYTTIANTTTTAVTGALATATISTAYSVRLIFTLQNSTTANTLTLYGESSSSSYTLSVEPGSACGWLP